MDVYDPVSRSKSVPVGRNPSSVVLNPAANMIYVANGADNPVSAIDAKTCIRWLKREQPNVSEAVEATSRIMKDGSRATEIIDRLRSLYKKSPPQRELVEVDETIREMLVLLRGEANRYSISMRTELSPLFPK